MITATTINATTTITLLNNSKFVFRFYLTSSTDHLSQCTTTTTTNTTITTTTNTTTATGWPSGINGHLNNMFLDPEVTGSISGEYHREISGP